MISFATFDNFEKQSHPAADNESKAEDFAAFLTVPVGPPNFQPPQNVDLCESPEMVSVFETSESIPIDSTSYGSESGLNTVDFSQKTKALQTPAPPHCFPLHNAEIPIANGSKKGNSDKAAGMSLELQKPGLKAPSPMFSPPLTDFSPLEANLAANQINNKTLKMQLAVSRDGVPNDPGAATRTNEITAESRILKFSEPELIKQKFSSAKSSETPFFDLGRTENPAAPKILSQLNNQGTFDSKLPEKSLSEMIRVVRFADIDTIEPKASRLVPVPDANSKGSVLMLGAEPSVAKPSDSYGSALTRLPVVEIPDEKPSALKKSTLGSGGEAGIANLSETNVSDSMPSLPLKSGKTLSSTSNGCGVLPIVKSSGLTPKTTNIPALKSRAELVEIKESGIESSQARTTDGTLAAKLNGTEARTIEETAKITETEFVFNFDKFLTGFTKNSNVTQSPVKSPLESQKIFEQVEPQMLQIGLMLTDENEKKVMKMRLHPADLGTIEIRLEKNSAGGLVAHFETETEAVRQSLTQNLEMLRDALQNSGWQVEQLEVTCQKFSHGGGEHPADHSQRKESVELSPVAETNVDRNSINQINLPQLQPDRLLSVRA